MKRKVLIAVEIDPTEYHGAKDTPEGTMEVAIACLHGNADFSTEATITCEGEEAKTTLD